MDQSKPILWGVMIALTILMVFFVTNSYRLYVSDSRHEILQDLDKIVREESLYIDGDSHEALHKKYTEKDDILASHEDEYYQRLQRQLEKIQVRYELEDPVYTLVYDSSDLSFEFMGTSLSTPNFRHDHVKFSHDLLENHENGGVIDVYEDEDGKWLSAYAPIKDSTGETVALLVVDHPFSQVIHQARSQLFLYIIIFLIIGSVLMFRISNVLKKDQEIKEELVRKNEEIEQQSITLKENNAKLEQAKKTIEEKVKQLNLNNKLLDIKVEQRTLSLEKANKELNILLYRISHDVLGPIATIQGLCYLGKMEVTDDLGKMYVTKMYDTNEKLIGIIKNINHAYSIKTKDLDYQKFGLYELVESIREKIMKKDEAHITVVNNLNKKIEVNTDRFVLESAIIELMQNAVTFRDREKDESTLQINAEKWGSDHIRMTFIDNGIGIHGATRQDIFDMFNKDTAHSSGLGLGLYIVKDSLNKLKGNARLLDSEPGKTIFEIQFPA